MRDIGRQVLRMGTVHSPRIGGQGGGVNGYASNVLRRVFAQSDARHGNISLTGMMDRLESSRRRLSAVLAQ